MSPEPSSACPPRFASASLLAALLAAATRAGSAARHAGRRRRRPSGRGASCLPGVTARPFDVTIREAAGEPPTYVLESGVRIYGLGSPPGCPELEDPWSVGDLLRLLVPTGVEVKVAPHWGGEGLCFRLTCLETAAHAYGAVSPPGDPDAIIEGLDGALSRLDVAAWGGEPRG